VPKPDIAHFKLVGDGNANTKLQIYRIARLMPARVIDGQP
jgi:hypothetical protein